MAGSPERSGALSLAENPIVLMSSDFVVGRGSQDTYIQGVIQHLATCKDLEI